jgi:hypothetical protein
MSQFAALKQVEGIGSFVYAVGFAVLAHLGLLIYLEIISLNLKWSIGKPEKKSAVIAVHLQKLERTVAQFLLPEENASTMPIVSKTVTPKQTLSLPAQDSLPTELQNPNAIDYQQLQKWILQESKQHTDQATAEIKTFKQSFIERSLGYHPNEYVIEDHKGVISVKNKLFGKDLCYLFDSQKNNGFFIVSCPKKNIFDFQVR